VDGNCHVQFLPFPTTQRIRAIEVENVIPTMEYTSLSKKIKNTTQQTP
jgi:hypothetical protein